MAANQVDFKILPSDQFSVYSPATRSDKVITYFTLLSKLRGDILSVGQDDDPNNIVSAFYSSVGGTQTLHLVKADGSEVTASVPEPTVGTVTSVNLTASTGISVSGGPITTSGSITVTNTAPDQVVVLTGAGTTSISGTYPSFTITSNDQFVGTVTSVGLTMPAAFSVANSPVTTSGTLAVTAAGLSSQYIRGDGQLANFPTPGGGGSSVNYYLNGSVSQGTFGGVTYYELSKTPIAGAGTNFTRTSASGDGYVASFITDANDPDQINIPGGNFNLEFYFNSSSSGGSPAFYGELYKVSVSSVFTLIASGLANSEVISGGTAVDQYYTSISVPQTALLATDRLAIRVYVIVDGRNITLHTENSNFSEVITTFSTGLNSLNGLSDQVQYFAVGTSGTDFAISSSLDTHTFNLPTASATNRGALSSADWTTFNGKQGALTFSAPLVNTSGTISIPAATGLVDGYLSAANFVTFNGKQNAITLTTTGTTGAATLIGATLNIPNYADQFVGTVTSVNMSVPTGFAISGNPITTSGTLAVAFDTGYSLPTNASQTTWNTAYNDSITAFAYNTSTAVLTLTQQDAGTLTATVTLQPFSTTNLVEGTNLYYTDVRARLALGAGTGISYNTTTGVITNSAPDQVVVLTSGTGISTSGTYPSFTITNTAPDQVVSLTGAGTTTISGAYPSFTITSSDQFAGTVTSVNLTASTGISVSGGPITNSGSITVTNTAPDQTVVLTAGTGISTSGTYPSFTVTNSAPDLTVVLTASTGITTSGTYPNFTIANSAPDQTVVLTAGTGITTSGTYPNFTVTNSAPDQTVAITAGTGISVSGTYPNFTVTNSSPSSGGTVTSVAALTIGTTGTDLSSSVVNSTTTPVITLNVPTASATNRGALSSADWTTFNSKEPALTKGNLTEATSAVLTITGGTGAVIGTGTSIQVAQSGVSTSGFLSSTDWNTFNGKASNSFTTIAVATQGSIVADSATDTLTVVAGSGVTITTDAATDTLTISATGSGGTITGSGTANYVSKFTSASAIGDSIVYDSGTKVGISTTGPTAKLEILNTPSSLPTLGTASGNLALTDNGLWGMYFGLEGSSGKGWIQQMRNDSITSYPLLIQPVGGNVGIGTTAPGQKLQVDGSLLVNTGTSATAFRDIMMGGIGGWSSGESHGIDTVYNTAASPTTFSRIESHFDGTNGKMRFRNLYNASAPRTDILMTIQGNGNVGIGTDSPTYKFEVSDGTRTGVINPNASLDGIFIGVTQAKPLVFGTTDTERMRITPGGTLLVGHTAVPTETAWLGTAVFGKDTYNKVIIGSLNSTTTGAYVGGHNSAINAWADLNVAGTAVIFRTEQIERMRLASGGNFGIGTTTPGALLHVQGSNLMATFRNSDTAANQYTQLEFIAGSRDAYIWLGNQNTTSWAGDGGLNIYTGTGHMDFWTAATQKMRLTASGNLGIGTTSPGFKLTIVAASATDSDILLAGMAGVSNGFTVKRVSSSFVYSMIDGGLGINNATPTQALHVTGNIRVTGAYYDSSNSAGTSGQILSSTATGTSWIAAPSGGGITGSGTTNYVPKWTSGSAIGDSAIYDNAGNIGINTTAPVMKLHVSDVGANIISGNAISTSTMKGVMIQNTNNGDESIGMWFNTGGNHWSGITGQRTAAATNWATDLRFFTHEAALVDLTYARERMRINGEGNVGIGTTAPGAKLQVVGAAALGEGLLNISNTYASGGVYFPAAKIRNTRGDHSYGIVSEFSMGSVSGVDRPSILFYADAAAHSWQVGQVTSGWGSDDSFGIGYRANNLPNTFNAWPTSYFTILTSGNVGIGTTAPGSKLSISGSNSGSVPLVDLVASGSGAFQRGVRMLNSGMVASDSIMYSAGRSDDAKNMGQFYFTFAGAGSNSNRISMGLHSVDDVLNIMGSGNVGIGTTAPAHKLHVASSTTFGTVSRVLKLDQAASGGDVTQPTYYGSILLSGGGYNWGAIDTIQTNPSASWTSRMAFSTMPGGGDYNLYERMCITNGGNVGIGTTAPNSRLSVNGGDFEFNRGTGALGNNYVVINKGASNDGGFLLRRDNTNDWQIVNVSGTGNLTFYSYGSSSEVLTIVRSNGNVGINNTNASYKLDVTGDARINTGALGVNIAPSATDGRIDASNDIVAFSSSDLRLKENIKPIENALEKVKSLTGVEFDWKPELKHAHGYEGHDTGVIAQEVQEVMPTAIRTNDTGYLAVRYEKLIGLLIEANKELAARVEELESKLK